MSRKRKARRKKQRVEYGRLITLPPVDADSLRRYHHRLSVHLSFPCAAFLEAEESRRGEETFPVLVLGLRPVEEANLVHGLLVEIALGDERCVLPLHEIELVTTDSADDVLEYLLWFDLAFRADEAEPSKRWFFEPDDDQPRNLLRPILHLAVYCAGAGASTGAILKATEGAPMGAIIGAALMGVLGLLAGIWYGRLAARHRVLALRLVCFGGFGMVAGAWIGAMAGAVVAAYPGAIPGGIVGSLAGGRLMKRDPGAKITWGIAGAFLGGLVLAFAQDWSGALDGAGVGLLVGLASGMVLFLFLVFVMGMLYLSEK